MVISYSCTQVQNVQPQKVTDLHSLNCDWQETYLTSLSSASGSFRDTNCEIRHWFCSDMTCFFLAFISSNHNACSICNYDIRPRPRCFCSAFPCPSITSYWCLKVSTRFRVSTSVWERPSLSWDDCQLDTDISESDRLPRNLGNWIRKRCVLPQNSEEFEVIRLIIDTVILRLPVGRVHVMNKKDNTLVILEVLCMVTAPCSTSHGWTQIMCVSLVALLLLSQRRTVFAMPIATKMKFLADGCENINELWCFFKCNCCKVLQVF